MAVPVVNKESQLEKPVQPDASFREEVNSQPLPEKPATAADQMNGVAAKVVIKQAEESAVEETPVSQQITTTDPQVTAAETPMTGEPKSPAEAPVSASGGTPTQEITTKKLVEGHESAFEAKEPTSQALEESTVQEVVAEVLVKVAAGIPDEPTALPAPEDPSEDVTEKLGVVPDLKNIGQEPGILPEVTSVDMGTQNEYLEREPVEVLAKAIQSKVSSKYASSSISTRHLSGGFC
ncbi:uncharacterized protein LOC130134208 [Lampris incognitus]|uniref:uncharacterized protein LOC130134208 n=1 Tax=Lampris incognitus TaxID=2546036 RepID=UPI0024B4CAED|nr:uncharacterized protein LOC130134208 [Lampris incognitus]